MTNNPYAKIKQNSIMTASPQELTLMLYDGAVKFGNQAMMAIEKNDMEAAHNFIIRVQDIIAEFQATLDMEIEIAHNLDLLYDYIYRKLVEANLTKEIEPLSEAIDFIRELRNTWKQAIQLAKQPKQVSSL